MANKFGKFKSKNTGVTGTLRITTTEGAGYKWVPCLALLDETGRWLCSASWRTNHSHRAKQELTAMGFEPAPETLASVLVAPGFQRVVWEFLDNRHFISYGQLVYDTSSLFEASHKFGEFTAKALQEAWLI